MKTCLRFGVLITAGLLTAGCQDKHPDPVGLPPAVVEVAMPVVRGKTNMVTNYQVFTARTQAEQSVDVKARVTGYLRKINFTDGTMVKGPSAPEKYDGDILFEIDDSLYKANLDKAEADVLYAKASLAKAQAEYDIGLAVQKRDKTAISVQEIAKRLGVRDQAAASVKQADATRELAQQNFDWCKVRSPITGRASRHLIDVGNNISQGVSVLCNIVSLKPTWAYFNVDQNTALEYQRLVKEGKVKSARDEDVKIHMALGTDPLFNIEGSIDYISNQLDPNTGSIQVRGTFPNKDEKLSAGLFARVRVPISAPHEALLVNDQAIGTNQGQKFILVVSDANVVEFHPVKVGMMHDGLREVERYFDEPTTDAQGKQTFRRIEVLKKTDRVIVSGLQRVRPEAKVDPRLVDMQTLMPVKSSK